MTPCWVLKRPLTVQTEDYGGTAFRLNYTACCSSHIAVHFWGIVLLKGLCEYTFDLLPLCTCHMLVYRAGRRPVCAPEVSLIAPFCHTPISLASQDSAARFNFIVGIGDRMGRGAIGHVNYSLTRRSILGVSPALHEKKR